MPFIYYDRIDGNFMEITVLLKGYGSEAKTSLAYVPTSEDFNKGITKFVLDCVKKAMGEPCTPYILGVGLGGSSDIASVLAKKAFMRLPLRKANSDPRSAARLPIWRSMTMHADPSPERALMRTCSSG